LKAYTTSELRSSQFPKLPLPPRQADFHPVADFGEGPLLAMIIDPFGKTGSDLLSGSGI
jgi:hypothetical protein